MNETPSLSSEEISDEAASALLWNLGVHYLRAFRYQHSLAEHERMLEWLRSEAGTVWLSAFGIHTENVCHAIDHFGRRTLISKPH
jgi:hypothetical protein